MTRLIVVFALLLLSSPVWAQTVPTCPCSLEWTGNTEKDMSHYNLYYSQIKGQFPPPGEQTQRERINHPATQTGDVESTLNLGAGQWWFALTAVDTSGNESQKSTQVTVMVVDTAAPSIPLNFRVSIP